MSTAPPPSWPRARYTPGGGNPRLFFKIQGQFDPGVRLTPLRYGSLGVPAGCALQSYDRVRHATVLSLGLSDAPALHLQHQGLFDQVARAPQCLVLRGEVRDPSTFDYFRDAMGVVLAGLDAGGAAVFDPFLQTWWSAALWRSTALSAQGFAPSDHTVTLVSDEDDSSAHWVYTRGMSKFGRPDISVHDVPSGLVPAVEQLCSMLIAMLAAGAVVPDGQEVQTEHLPGTWQCRVDHSASDREFNNVRIEVRRIR